MERTDMHRLQELVRLHRMGRGARESARLLGMSPNTERVYRQVLMGANLYDGPLDELPALDVLKRAVLTQLPENKPEQQKSSLQAVVPRITKMAENGAFPKAIHDALRLEDKEFRGSLSAVKRVWRMWRKACGVRPQDVAISVETPPGHVAQVDFGYLGEMWDPVTKKKRKAWVFLCVLGFSRHMFAKVVFDQRAETWIALHVEAFQWFGGVPEVIVPDNLKSAVICAAFGVDRDQGDLNRSYVELARHYGFQIDPAPVRAPQKKGKVEAGVKYLRRSFYLPLAGELRDIDEAQERLRRWVVEVAGRRTHGTLHVQPLVLFENEEKEALMALPDKPYVMTTWRRVTVHKNSHVLFDRREYSVPWRLVGERVWVQATPESVYVIAGDERVATHSRRGPGLRSTVEGHLPEVRRELAERVPERWVERAARMGPEVADYIREVLGSSEVLSQVRVVQSMVLLLEEHPHRAEAACRRAHHFGALKYAALRDILRQGLDAEALPEASPPQSPPAPGFRFARNPPVPALLH